MEVKPACNPREGVLQNIKKERYAEESPACEHGKTKILVSGTNLDLLKKF